MHYKQLRVICGIVQTLFYHIRCLYAVRPLKLCRVSYKTYIYIILNYLLAKVFVTFYGANPTGITIVYFYERNKMHWKSHGHMCVCVCMCVYAILYKVSTMNETHFRKCRAI